MGTSSLMLQFTGDDCSADKDVCRLFERPKVSKKKESLPPAGEEAVALASQESRVVLHNNSGEYEKFSFQSEVTPFALKSRLNQ